MYKKISEKYEKNIYKPSIQSIINIYVDEKLLNPKYILDFKYGCELFENELQLGSVPSQYIEMKIHKLAGIKSPKGIRIEYGILINNALTVEELNKKLVGEINKLKIKSLSGNDNNFEIIPMGEYIVDEYVQSDGNTFTIKALDNIIKLDTDNGYYDASKLIEEKGYVTIGELAQDICNKKGLELETSSFLNSEKMIAVYDNQLTAREYMSYIAEVAGGFCCANRTGKVCFRKIGEDEVQIPLKLFKTYDIGERFKISRVAYEDGIRSFKYGDETENTLWIRQENLFIVDENQIENIYNELNGLSADSFEGTVIIDPAIDIGDKIIVDGKETIFQGEMTLSKRFIADIKSKIAIKQKEETTVKKENQKIINRKIQSEINQIDGKIIQLVEEQNETSTKITKQEQDIEGIRDTITQIEDLSRKVEDTKTITLENCMKGNLLELIILGNNTVFEHIYASNNLITSNTLYPWGDSRIKVTNEDGTENIYELGIQEVLRKSGEVYDEYVLKEGQASVIRRINKDGTVKEKEIVEELGPFSINLKDGTNIISIENYTAKMQTKYAIKSKYTDMFATKVEMNSKLELQNENINIELSKKTDTSNIIASINMSTEKDKDGSTMKLSADKIDIAGQAVNFTTGIGLEHTYTEEDSQKAFDMYMQHSTATQEELEKYDVDGDGEITLFDSQDILLAIENNKGKVRGTFTIDPYSLRETIVFRNYNGEIITVIGLSRMKTERLISDYLTSKEINTNTIIAETVTQTSLEKSKKNFEELQDGLNIVKATQIYKYNFKNEEDGSKKHIGFVIGNGYKYSSEITSNNQRGKENGVDIYSMVSVAYKAIQELNTQVEQLKNEVKNMKNKEG